MTVPFDTSQSLILPAAANLPFTDMLDMFSSSGTLYVNMYLSWRDICMMISGLHLEKKENGRARVHPCLSRPGSISLSSNRGLNSPLLSWKLRADPVQNGYIFDYICTAYCFTILYGYQHNADDGFQMCIGSTWYIGLYVK